jgi:hypothetical protein
MLSPVSKVVIGDCRLCDARGVRLLDSHIVTKAAYRRILDGRAGEPKETKPVMVTKETSVLTNTQMHEHLLCKPCEDRFCRWEDYAFPLLSQGDGSFPWLARVRPANRPEVGDSSMLDVDQLSLFAVSLFWRLHVSRERKVMLGPYESLFRAYLMGYVSFPAEASLVVSLLDPSRSTVGVRVDRSFCIFNSTRVGGCHLHRFAILGVDMGLFVGRTLPRRFADVSLSRCGLVAIRPTDSYALQLARVAARSVPKASLATRVV